MTLSSLLINTLFEHVRTIFFKALNAPHLGILRQGGDLAASRDGAEARPCGHAGSAGVVSRGRRVSHRGGLCGGRALGQQSLGEFDSDAHGWYLAGGFHHHVLGVGYHLCFSLRNLV
jgi:hypothetical protein